MTSSSVQAIKTRAIELHGTTVVVNLIGGQSLTGTLAYALDTHGGRYTEYPDVLSVTISTKVHTVRLDHVSAIGQG
ncbi:hypothetical protein [Streptomyces nojiriensis]|uniref:hypothetical protein n=1 Tax=Streptomyces nojiriensis TaxID=66374 RepID=UPI0035DF02CB